MNSLPQISKTKFLNHRMLSALLLSIMAFSGTSSAALVDRGGGLIYDDDLNITWLADANYAQTSGYDVDGYMTWDNSMTWASTLSYYDSVRDQTLTGWHLPTADPTCVSFGGDLNCVGGELGHLFYNELGGTAGSSLLSSTDPDLALFTNISPDYYWLNVEYELNLTRARVLFIDSGSQDTDLKSYINSAWAVRAGDVGAVPIPAAVWLFGSGLIGLIGVAGRKKA